MAAKKKSKTSVHARSRPAPKKEPTPSLGTCFVVAPFRAPPSIDLYWNKVFRPAIEAANLEPRRADDIYISREIIKDIWTGINDAKLVLADLTGRNENVMYELGLAHAIGKPAILIARNLDELPFDLRPYRTILYDVDEPGWDETLRTTITQFVRATLKDPNGSVPAPFLREQKSATPATAVTPQDKKLIELQRRVEKVEAAQGSGGSWLDLNSPGLGMSSSNLWRIANGLTTYTPVSTADPSGYASNVGLVRSVPVSTPPVAIQAVVDDAKAFLESRVKKKL